MEEKSEKFLVHGIYHFRLKISVVEACLKSNCTVDHKKIEILVNEFLVSSKVKEIPLKNSLISWKNK